MRLTRYQRPNVWAWSAFDQLTNLRDEINRLFDGSEVNGASDAFNVWAPAVDLLEDKDSLILRAEVPGMRKEDIDISLHENTVTISGERRDEKKYEEGAQSSRQERSFGRFTRSLALPKQVDTAQVRASYKDGILTVTLPKAAGARPRQIQIQN
jgi:HSP20 family protein